MNITSALAALLAIEASLSTPAPIIQNEFKLVNIKKGSAEFENLLDTFSAGMQQHNSAYVKDRIMRGLKPVSI